MAFTADQAASANKALRAALGLPPQLFSEQQFVGMISEEIGQLRAAGKSDEAIASLLKDDAGIDISAQSISRFFVADVESL